MDESGLVEDMFICKKIPPLTYNEGNTVIFLHGAGDTGPGIESWIKSRLMYETGLVFPHIRVIYPTAPKRPYTAAHGEHMSVWFDWPSIDPSLPEDLTSIDYMCNQLSKLIDTIVEEGSKPHQIILGGLSMGGAMALHLGYRYHTNLAGVFAMSTFLNTDSIVYKVLENHKGPHPPLFQTHGDRDQLIRHEWGEKTFQQLKNFGVKGTFHTYPSLGHDMCKAELEDLREWIQDILPIHT